MRIAVLGVVIVLFGGSCQTRTVTPPVTNRQSFENAKTTSNMEISSPAFGPNETLPKKFTCDGEGVSPSLEIKNIPDGTRSLALVMDDPDAPGGTFVHWIVFNIPPQTSSITEGTGTQGLMGANSLGETGYFGACPPSGLHRYIFHLYALDASLDLKAGASRSKLDQAMIGHILGQTELHSIYQR